MGDGFSNAIVGGVGKLIRAFIQSPNYLAGKTGWSINKDGSVDFNNGTFRSNVIITDSAGNVVTVIDANGIKVTNGGPTSTAYVLIRTNQATGVPQIELNPETVSGVTISGGSIFTQPPSGATPGNHGPTMAISGPSQDTLLPARIELLGQGKVDNSRIILTANDIASPAILFRDANGVVETWHPVTFLNGWSNLGGAYVTMQYRKVVSPPNSVQLVGVMNIGTKVAGTVVGNLPVGYRPLHTVRVPVSSNGSNSGGQTPAFDILANGDIIVASGSGFPAAATDCEVNAVVPLDA